MHLHLALYQPDIPQNVGAAIRLAACLNISLHIIEPCAFPWKESEFRRTAMDYGDLIEIKRHTSWNAFLKNTPKQRKVLMTTKAATNLYHFEFQEDDIILMGRESAGVPDNVHESVEKRIIIPMSEKARSLNIVNAASIACGEAIRQIRFN